MIQQGLGSKCARGGAKRAGSERGARAGAELWACWQGVGARGARGAQAGGHGAHARQASCSLRGCTRLARGMRAAAARRGAAGENTARRDTGVRHGRVTRARCTGALHWCAARARGTGADRPKAWCV